MLTDNHGMWPVMNLQLFAEEGEPQQGTTQPEQQDVSQATSEKQITPEEQETLLSYFERYMQGEPEESAPEDKPQEPATPMPAQKEPAQQDQLILGKFKSYKDLENAYLEEQKKITQQGQQLAEMQRQWQQFFLNQQQYQSQLQQLQNPPLSPEEIQRQNEEWLNKFYEKPVDTLSELVQKNVQQVVQQYIVPISQKLQYQESLENFNRQLQEAREKYPDFEELLPEMNKIAQEYDSYYANVPNAVEAIYGLAKARMAGQAARPIEQQLDDPQIVEKILQNDRIKNAVLKKYVQQIKQGQPPSVIGTQPGEMPASPPVDFSQPGSAKKATLTYLRNLFGGGAK